MHRGQGAATTCEHVITQRMPQSQLVWDYRLGNQLLLPQSLALQSIIINDIIHTSVDSCTLIIKLIQTYTLKSKLSLRESHWCKIFQSIGSIFILT